MKKSMKHFAMAALALLAMTACNNEIDEQGSASKGKQPVQFQMTMGGSTRTTTDTNADRTTTWDEGDAVGIFVYKQGETTNPVAVNAKYVLTGDNWIAQAGSEIYAEEAYDYYAYYPYKEGVTDPTSISISALDNQSATTGKDYGMSDVLAAQNKTIATNAVTVPLLFKHMFAMVEVKVEGDKVSKQPTKVELKGVKLDATLDIMDETPNAQIAKDAKAVDVTMYYLKKATDADKAPFSFRAVVPAQEIAASTPLVAIYAPDADNKTYTMQYSANVTYDAGKFRQLVVSIGTAKVSLTIPKGDMTIDPWGPSPEVPGTGSTEEMPVTSLSLTLPADDSAFKSMVTHSSSALLSGDTDFWFKRSPVTPISVISIETDGDAKVIKAVNAGDKGLWTSTSFGFHSTSPFAKDKIYALTLKQKSTIAEGVLGISIRNSGDTKGFQMVTVKSNVVASFLRNITTVKSSATPGEWTTTTVYLNFAQCNATAFSSLISTWDNSIDTDVKGINLYFYNYSPTCDVMIKDIQLTATDYVMTPTVQP